MRLSACASFNAGPSIYSMFPRITFTLRSKNSKTGRIPVSISPSSTCPDACPFKQNGCYAKYGPMAMHWRNVEANGREFSEFLAMVAGLKPATLWRAHSAGDLPNEGETTDSISRTALGLLIEANRGRNGFTYTHKPCTPEAIRHMCKVQERAPVQADWQLMRDNRAAVAHANLNGFTVNLSMNSIAELDAFGLTALPVAVVIPERTATFEPREFKTPGGNQVVVCPAQWRATSCEDCGLCQKSNRKFAIGFHAHGQDKKRVSLKVLQAT